MIKLSKTSKIFVLCPAAFASGGPELLHQLVYKLNKLGFDAYMNYYFSKHQSKKMILNEEAKFEKDIFLNFVYEK